MAAGRLRVIDTHHKHDGVVSRESVDVCVIGAGFSGVVATVQLLRQGVSVILLEKGSDVGGTWYWNRYPGAACDVPSYYYSYSFSPEVEQEWTWSRKFARQPEILSYIQHVARRFNVYDHARFHTAATSVTFNESTHRWGIQTDVGLVVDAQFVVVANGPLSTPKYPDINGMDTFQGTSLHTSRWDDTIDLTNKVVGVVGTGATAIQVIPEVAPLVKHLYVFQRTPATSVAREDRLTTPAFDREFKRDPVARRAYYNTDTDRHWDIVNDPVKNEEMQQRARATIRAVVNDPVVAEKLCPYYPFWCKRVALHDEYYPVFNRSNVTLVDTNGKGLRTIEPKGPVVDGQSFPLDVLLYATGFDALNGENFNALQVTGVGGRRLAEEWSKGPCSLYGIHVDGFPNLFIMHGPHSPSVLANMVHLSEFQTDYIVNLVTHMRTNGHLVVDALPGAVSEWTSTCDKVARTKVQSKCNNWYNKDGVGNVGPYTDHLSKYLAAVGGEDAYLSLRFSS